MKRIYLVRHAKAEDYDPARHAGDADRRLTGDGRRAFESVAKKLRRIDDGIEIVYTSPLRRARETAEILADAMKVDVAELRELEPPMHSSRLLERVRRMEAKRVALVGHEPGMGNTLAAWIGAGSHSTPFRKGAIARVDVGGEPGEAPYLAWFAPPDLFLA